MKSRVLDLLRDPVDGSRLILEKAPGDPKEDRFPSLASLSGGRYPIVRSVPRFVLDAPPDPQWRIRDTFDWYSPKCQWTHSDEEVESWFREAGLAEIWHGSYPVFVRGLRT